MTIILTVGKESVMLKDSPSVTTLVENLKGARSVTKGYNGKWDINARDYTPVIEFTVLPYDLEIPVPETDIPVDEEE